MPVESRNRCKKFMTLKTTLTLVERAVEPPTLLCRHSFGTSAWPAESCNQQRNILRNELSKQ
mgnify:CR=1 FL=1